MSATGGEANEFERLKTLLFSPEASRLSEAESHIEGLENWVGDAKRLEAATADRRARLVHGRQGDEGRESRGGGEGEQTGWGGGRGAPRGGRGGRGRSSF